MKRPTTSDYESMEDFHVANVAYKEWELAEWAKLPPIQRIERWYDVAHSIDMGHAFQLLGESLRDWAKEQQRK